MHVVIAWWDERRTADPRDLRLHPSGKTDPQPWAGEFPGLCTGRWITDPGADRQGLALIWDSAASADLSLPALSQRVFGCDPSHRWGFEFDDTTPPHEAGPGLPPRLDLLLHA